MLPIFGVTCLVKYGAVLITRERGKEGRDKEDMELGKERLRLVAGIERADDDGLEELSAYNSSWRAEGLGRDFKNTTGRDDGVLTANRTQVKEREN